MNQPNDELKPKKAINLTCFYFIPKHCSIECMVCKKYMCSCPERQEDGSWKCGPFDTYEERRGVMRDFQRVEPIQHRFVEALKSMMRQYENVEHYSEGALAEDVRKLLKQYDLALKEKSTWKLTQVEAKAKELMP